MRGIRLNTGEVEIDEEKIHYRPKDPYAVVKPLDFITLLELMKGFRPNVQHPLPRRGYFFRKSSQEVFYLMELPEEIVFPLSPSAIRCFYTLLMLLGEEGENINKMVPVIQELRKRNGYFNHFSSEAGKYFSQP